MSKRVSNACGRRGDESKKLRLICEDGEDGEDGVEQRDLVRGDEDGAERERARSDCHFVPEGIVEHFRGEERNGAAAAEGSGDAGKWERAEGGRTIVEEERPGRNEHVSAYNPVSHSRERAFTRAAGRDGAETSSLGKWPAVPPTVFLAYPRQISWRRPTALGRPD